jgi:hypothetical protein
MLPLILVAVGAYLIGDSVLEDKKYAEGGKTDDNKIKFYEVVKSIKDLEYDGDPEDLRLHHEERFNWGADNKKDYDKAAEEIENLSYSGKGWTVYATHDVSGFDYWMNKQQEQNYITIAVMFDKDTIDEDEVENLRKALGNALDDAENIADKYDYVPQDDDDYKKGGKTQGYDDKEDERLAMEHGKMSKKDLDSTHARRDDARFEERGKMAKGGKLSDAQVIAKLEKKFANKELDDDYGLTIDGYETAIFDWKEEDEKDAYLKKHSKDNYLVPWDNQDDNWIYIIVPKDKMAKGGKVDYGSLYQKIIKAVQRDLKLSKEDATDLVDKNEAFIVDMIEYEEIKSPNQIADAITSDYGEAEYKKGGYMAKGGEASKKNFNTMMNVGKSKYVINYHNGEKTHKDGSPFYDLVTFKNKKDFDARKKALISEGYKEM